MELSNKWNSALGNRVKRLFPRCVALSAVFVFAISSLPHAAGEFQPYRLVNVPTAGVLPKASFDVAFRVYAPPLADGYGSGLLMGVDVGLTNRLNIGLSYGGEGIIGYSDHVRWNGLPGVLVKYRLFEEKFLTPALAVGFDNQGYGGRAVEAAYGYDGYVYKSPGFFVALSKNYLMFRYVQIGFHGAVSYSLEEAGEVKWPNAAFGVDIGINDELTFVIEYDAALNDITGPENYQHYGQLHRGFLNLGLRWAFTENFVIEFDMADILENKTRREPPTLVPLNPNRRVPIGWSRELKVAYISKI